MREPAHIPTDASGGDIIAIIRRWAEVLANGNHELIGSDLGYGPASGESNSVCLLRAVRGMGAVKKLGRPCSEIATAA